MNRVGGITRRRLGAVAVAAGLAVAGCGIPLDAEPRDVTDDALTAPGAAASDTAASPTGQRVFFVAAEGDGEVRLRAVRRDVPSAVGDVLGALFKGLTDTERTARRLTSQIPVGTRLLSVTALSDGTVVIDVDRTIFEAGSNLSIAVGQIVYTATSVSGIERVRLLVDGQPRDWPAGDGRERSGDLTPLAFPSLYPADEPTLPPVPSPTGPTTAATTSLPPAPAPPAGATTTAAATVSRTPDTTGGSAATTTTTAAAAGAPASPDPTTEPTTPDDAVAADP